MSRKIYLASKSPRRHDLLKAAEIPFDYIDLDVEETFPEDLPIHQVPEYLARKKAEAAFDLVSPDDIIIAADVIVVFRDQIFGKPVDEQDARRLISALCGHEHLVITGVFIGHRDKAVSFSDHTQVWLDPITEDELDFYVKEYKPFDKAGSYGIQDWIGWTKVSRIEGSYANVMGLPIHRVYQVLRDWDVS